MSQRKVIIEIETDGSSKVDAQGFQGQSCALATREIELALAGDFSNVDDKKKPDFFAMNPGSQTQKN